MVPVVPDILNENQLQSRKCSIYNLNKIIGPKYFVTHSLSVGRSSSDSSESKEERKNIEAHTELYSYPTVPLLSPSDLIKPSLNYYSVRLCSIVSVPAT